MISDDKSQIPDNAATAKKRLGGITSPKKLAKLSSTLKVLVAEGVEALEEWNTVKSIGGRVVQGFLVGKPMPVASLARWYKDWDARVQNSGLFDKLSDGTPRTGDQPAQEPGELKSELSSPSLEEAHSQKVSEES